MLEDPTALLLAATADAVLLVVESGRTTRADLKRARRELEAVGACLVGAVLRE
jgi:Mrp family chromosome partitioning ATPase